MAITKIHAIKSTLSKAIAYIENPEKTDGQLLVSGYNVDPQMASVDFEMTASLARHVHHTGKRSTNLAYHMIQSFSPNDVLTPEQAHELGRQLAAQFTDGRFEYVVATHIDKENHIHNHIMINAVSFYDYKRLRTVPYRTAREIRSISDRICAEANLSVIESPKFRGQRYEEQNPTGPYNTKRSALQVRLDEAISKTSTYEDFKRYAAELGVTVNDTGKHIKFFLEGSQRWIRGSSLAPNGSYELSGIQERISLPHQDNTQGNFQEILSRYPNYEKARTTPKIQSNRTELRSRLRFILQRACTYEEFVQMAAALGISVDNTEKHIKFRMDGAERWTRGKTLSDQGLYEAPEIRDQLEQNQGSLPFLQQAIKKAAQQASSLDEYLALLSEQGIDAKENRKTSKIVYAFSFQDSTLKVYEDVLEPILHRDAIMDAIRTQDFSFSSPAAQNLAEQYDTDQKRRPKDSPVWVALSKTQIQHVSDAGLLVNVRDAQNQPATLYVPKYQSAIDDTGQLHISLCSSMQYVLERDGGRTYHTGEALIRQIELENHTACHRLQLDAAAIKSISARGVTITLPSANIERLFIPTEFVHTDKLTGTCSVDLYDDWHYRYTSTDKKENAHSPTLAMSGSILYKTITSAFPTPSIGDADLKQKIRFAERQAGLTRAKQLANTLSQMSRYGLHTSNDFDVQIHALDQRAAEIRTKITGLEDKNKSYALAARCLQTYQKLLPIWQSVQYAPFFMRKHYMATHKTELDAFHQAEAALKRLGVNDTVEPEKVANLVQHQVQQIEHLKQQLENIKSMQQELIRSQSDVREIQQEQEQNNERKKENAHSL